MKFISLLFFSFLAGLAYGEEAADEPAEDSTEEATEEIAKPPPQRLSGKTERDKAPANERKTMMLLGKDIDEEHSEWLDTTYGPFMSIWYQDQSGSPKGALLIVHAEGESAHWPETTAPLHHSLPDSGWSTMAITLPLPEKKLSPKRSLPTKVKRISTATSNDEQEDADASDGDELAPTKKTTSVKEVAATNLVSEVPASNITMVKPMGPDPEAVSLARLKAAVGFLHDKGQFNIVIAGYGSGAVRANALIDSLTPKIDNPNVANATKKPFTAFIIVNGSNYLPNHPQKVEWFSDPSIPVLDVFINVHQRHRLAAKTRKIAAKRAKVTTYQLIGLPEIIAQSQEENRLSRRIRSFLKKHVEGVEVNNARVRRYQ